MIKKSMNRWFMISSMTLLSIFIVGILRCEDLLTPFELAALSREANCDMYLRIMDQAGKAVVGAKIHAKIGSYKRPIVSGKMREETRELTVISDENGVAHIVGGVAYGVSINIVKDGYLDGRVAGGGCLRDFTFKKYQDPYADATRYRGSAESPQVITVWKKMGPQKITKITVPPRNIERNGDLYSIDLSNGHLNLGDSGDVVIKIKAPSGPGVTAFTPPTIELRFAKDGKGMILAGATDDIIGVIPENLLPTIDCRDLGFGFVFFSRETETAVKGTLLFNVVKDKIVYEFTGMVNRSPNPVSFEEK